MTRPRTARILSFDPFRRAPDPSGGTSRPRHTEWCLGLEMAGSRAGEATARAPDPTVLEVLPHLYSDDPRRLAQFQRDVQTNASFLLRGRAGAIVGTVVRQTARNAPTLQGLEVLHSYRTILRAWTWPWLVEAVRATRSYQAGLDAGLLLLRVAEQHRARLSHQEYTTHRKELYWFILEMLDRLDRWDVYLATWDRVRAHTAYTLMLHPGARQRYGPQLAPFTVGEDARRLTVHFLWSTVQRKALIARKVERQRRGQKLGNVIHATQDELTTDDLRERLAWVAREARDASWCG